VAIELCIELKDCYFLFYDIFMLFEDEGMIEIFLEELEPFILSGNFREWALPNEILSDHIIKYYKLSKKPIDIEKILFNLNFTNY